MTKLEITIGKKVGYVVQTARAMTLIVAVMIIPTFNELVLSGHWSIHLIGAFIALVAVAGAFRTFMPTVKRFDDKEAAAEWVRSGKWEVR